MAKRPVTAEAAAKQAKLERLTGRLERPAERDYLDTWSDNAEAVPQAALEGAIEDGPDKAADLLVPLGLTAAIGLAMVNRGVEAGTTVEIGFLPAPLVQPAKDILLITPVPPRAATWATRRAAELVTEVDPATKEALRNIVRTGIDEAQHVRTIAANVRKSVGIHSRNEAAVQRKILEMRANGVKESVVQRTAARQRKAAVRYRANVIARTETVQAVEQGRREMWNEMVDKGHVIVAKIEKEWMTAGDERVCPICGPLEGEVVIGLRAPFPGGFQNPPAHIGGCRCASLYSEVTK